MKKILLALLICAGVASCKDDDPGTEPPKPTVSLTEGTSTTTSITFTVTPDEAEKCAYLYAKVEENAAALCAFENQKRFSTDVCKHIPVENFFGSLDTGQAGLECQPVVCCYLVQYHRCVIHVLIRAIPG